MARRQTRNYVIDEDNREVISHGSMSLSGCEQFSLSFFYCPGVGGVKVSIVAFQAIDPGSIPGRRTFLFPDLNCSRFKEQLQIQSFGLSNYGSILLVFKGVMTWTKVASLVCRF